MKRLFVIISAALFAVSALAVQYPSTGFGEWDDPYSGGGYYSSSSDYSFNGSFRKLEDIEVDPATQYNGTTGSGSCVNKIMLDLVSESAKSGNYTDYSAYYFYANYREQSISGANPSSTGYTDYSWFLELWPEIDPIDKVQVGVRNDEFFSKCVSACGYVECYNYFVDVTNFALDANEISDSLGSFPRYDYLTPLSTDIALMAGLLGVYAAAMLAVNRKRKKELLAA